MRSKQVEVKETESGKATDYSHISELFVSVSLSAGRLSGASHSLFQILLETNPIIDFCFSPTDFRWKSICPSSSFVQSESERWFDK